MLTLLVETLLHLVSRELCTAQRSQHAALSIASSPIAIPSSSTPDMHLDPAVGPGGLLKGMCQSCQLTLDTIFKIVSIAAR